MNIPLCNVSYPISLEDLFNNHIKPALPSYENIEHWHKLLMEYIQKENSILLIRKVKIEGEDLRGKIITGKVSGTKMLFSDNAPAWAVYYYAFKGNLLSLKWWREMQNPMKIPCHRNDVFKIIGNNHYNSRRWHIAHINPINDNTKPRKKNNPLLWDGPETIKRHLLFLHPLNIFPFPLELWRSWPGNPLVLSYISKKFNSIYGDLRREFLAFIGITNGLSKSQNTTDEENKLIISFDRKELTGKKDVGNNMDTKEISDISELLARSFDTKPSFVKLKDGKTVAFWRSTRLCFKQDGIEKLQKPDDLIAMEIAPKNLSDLYSAGYVVMSKREFYSEFDNVALSRSFLGRGFYNPVAPPAKMDKYFIPKK